MDIILVPGFWLDGSAWDAVTPALTAAGHRVTALTLPGLESKEADRSTIRLADHVAAVVAAIDAASGPVVLVGHSGGGAIANGAADARPNRVARMVYVDCWPAAHGEPINDGMPMENGEIPLPPWSDLPEEDLRDLDDDLRAMFRERAIPQPAGVACDPQVLTDERRLDIPATVIACEMTSEDLRSWMQPDHAWSGAFTELAMVKQVTWMDLPTGHWPMFTRPTDLAAAILEAVD